MSRNLAYAILTALLFVPIIPATVHFGNTWTSAAILLGWFVSMICLSIIQPETSDEAR